MQNFSVSKGRCFVVFASTLSLFSIANSVMAQDAFGSGPGGGDTRFQTFTVGSGGPTFVWGVNESSPEDYDYADDPEYADSLGQAPALQGRTNGWIYPSAMGSQAQLLGSSGDTSSTELVRIPRAEFKKLVEMPDGLDLLGLSFCDQTCLEIAAQEPNSPDAMLTPRAVSLSQASKGARSSYEGNNFQKWGTSLSGWNLGVYVDPERRAPGEAAVVDGRLDKFIEPTLLAEVMRVGEICGNNPDYQARLAAYGLKYRRHFRERSAKEVALDASDAVSSKGDSEIALLKRVLRVKTELAAIKPRSEDPGKRMQSAEKFEREGNYYEALVDRLRLEEMQDDAVSRYRVAVLYRELGEHKLAYEKVKEALECQFKPSEKSLQCKANILAGDILMEAVKEADRHGSLAISQARLRNATAAYRRACLLCPFDTAVGSRLLKAARLAEAMESNVENKLMLVGAYRYAGDSESAQNLLDELVASAGGDIRVKQIRYAMQITRR